MVNSSKGITRQTFNRFGVKKQITYTADSAAELSFFAKQNARKVLQMTEAQYMELEDYNPVLILK